MRRLALLLAVVSVAVGCKERNPDYCPDAGVMFHKSCSEYNASLDAQPDVTDARDAEGGGDAADAQDLADAVEAAPEVKPPICVVDDDCRTDGGTFACDTVDGGAMCVECTKNEHCAGTKPVCDPAARKCVECTGAAANAALECKVDSKKSVCLASSQSCVQCLDDSKCSGVTPKCDGHICRACRSDAECGGENVCLDSGACASAEVIFVEFKAAGCAGATGASDKPFCNPSDAVAAVAAGKGFVIVIKGPASGPLLLDTPVTTTIVVVGRKNTAGESPVIPLGVLTGVHVSTGNVLVRDLAVTGGTAASAKGAVVTGAGVTLTLRNVSIDTGTGLGVQADTGATLAMDQCTVKNNPGGGLLINGASYNVTNSVFATSSYGVKFNVPKAPTSFAFNTVVANTSIAVSCDLSNPQTLTASIVAGFNDSCTLTNCVTTAPTFDAARPFRLTAHLACPMAPASFPDHDIDGDARTAPIDCGADQFK